MSKVAANQISLSDFDVRDVCGRGASSVVFKARHRESGQPVALKCLSRDRFYTLASREILKREINLHRQLRSDNVVRLLSHFTTDDSIYIVLELCDETLGNYLESQGGVLDEREAGSIVRDIAMGLAAVHESGCVHRDLKLENILLRKKVAKIADFGCAQICAEGRLTRCGTLDYVSPEMIAYEPHTTHSDVWALGVIACELLGGRPPFFRDGRADTLRAICEAEPQLPPNISRSTSELLHSIFQKDPSARPHLQDVLDHPFCANRR